MKILLLTALLFSTFATAGDQIVTKNSSIAGKSIIESILADGYNPIEENFPVVYGNDADRNDCGAFLIYDVKKNFLEVVQVDQNKIPSMRFYISDDFKYSHTKIESNVDGEVGFHTTDTYKIGKNSLEIQKAGDSYFELRMKVDGKESICNVDF